MSLVDLFSGCGGLTLGLAEAARRLRRPTSVRLAVDHDPAAIDTFEANLPTVSVRVERVESLFDGDLGTPPTRKEDEIAELVGDVHLLGGGPPCQGNSDLNNHTRHTDDRNALYDRMARAAEVLRPVAVLVENVPAIRRDRREVVKLTIKALEEAGYQCVESVVDSVGLGIPQHRRRHILLAARDGCFDPGELLRELRPPCPEHPMRTVQWAIEDLEHLEEPGPLDKPSNMSKENKDRIDWLFGEDEFDLPNDLRPKCHRSDHTYRSMYGRLRWHQPAQTVTTGFGSMGQGRYVHPGQRRTITPHEAARLQTFPDFYDFGGSRHRGVWARMIGNAVPPLLNVIIGKALIPILLDSEVSKVDVEPVGSAYARPSSDVVEEVAVGV